MENNSTIFLIVIASIAGLKIFDVLLRMYVDKLEKDIEKLEEEKKQDKWKKRKTKR